MADVFVLGDVWVSGYGGHPFHGGLRCLVSDALGLILWMDQGYILRQYAPLLS